MDRQHILDEIRRTAVANGGKPLGRERFQAETGIRYHEWMRYWARFGDALREAGFEANTLQAAHDESVVMSRVVQLARELGRFPTHGELRVKRTNDATFPGKGTFDKYGKAKLMALVAAFCHANPGNEDIAAMCNSASVPVPGAEPSAKPNTSADGFVYLLKSGRYYKIGKTNHAGRRERELAIQLPDAATTVHTITTDDPDGIEEYWHQRFAAKRKNGEWFDLDRVDVAAFRRRKFM